MLGGRRLAVLCIAVLGLLVAADTPAHAAAERPAPTPQEQLQQALRLQDAGFDAQARKLIEAVARESSTPIPAQLRAVNQRVGWWRRFLGLAGPVLRTTLEILAACFGAVVALLLVFTGLNALRGRFVASAQLAGFTGSKDETLAPVLSSALSAMLARMSDQSAGRRINWQSGTEPKFAIPTAVTEAVPQAGLLSGLVQMLDGLLYRRLFIVSGTVHPVHSHRGAGVTLVVTDRSGRRVEQVTVWEQEFMLKEAGADTADAVRYERLILPVAVWLAYRPMLGFKPGGAPLGARDWRSYALFALAELVPDPVKERRLYETALDLDSHNLGARLNLAAMLLQGPEVSDSDVAVRNGSREGWGERMQDAGRHLGVVATHSSPAIDPIWYRARYMQAVRSVYLGKGADAKRSLAELRREMSIHATKPALRALVEALEQPISVLELTAGLVGGGPVEGLADLGSGWLTASAEYNLACFWARYAGRATDEQERTARTVEAVRSLRRAIDRGQDAVAEARVDPAFDPIRPSDGFKALVEEHAQQVEAAEPTRYAITLDPGPDLVGLARAWWG